MHAYGLRYSLLDILNHLTSDLLKTFLYYTKCYEVTCDFSLTHEIHHKFISLCPAA